MKFLATPRHFAFTFTVIHSGFVGAGSATKKTGRRERQPLSAGESSCLLQQPKLSPANNATDRTLTKSKLAAMPGYADPGIAAASVPLLAAGRPAYEMPPSYETACGGIAERLMMAADTAVCTITGSNPSAVAFRSYPAPSGIIPDQLYQNGELATVVPDWRAVSDEFGGGSGTSRTVKRTLPMSPAHIQAMQQCAVQRHQHQHPGQRDHGPPGTWQAPPPSHRRAHHYPTPPSQHGYTTAAAAVATQPYDLGCPGTAAAAARVPLPYHHPDQFLTPSPDSPGQWSSSSPHSGQSDWSEGISSPAQAASYHHQNQPAVPNNQRLAQANCCKDGIFLVRT